MKLQMTTLAILLSSVVTANAGSGWNFFGITVPYHNDPCWEMFAEPLYQDQCNPKDGDDKPLKVPSNDKPVVNPPKDDKPKGDDNGSDTDDDSVSGGDGVTNPGDDNDTPDDNNGGDTRDHSDSNGDNSSDDSNGDNSEGDNGHGNDDDRHDDSNPGKGKGKGPKVK